MPLLSRLSFIQLCKETTQGTAASSNPVYFPVQDAQGEELPHYINDDSLVNNVALVRGVYQGERDSMFTWNGFVYEESVANLFVAAGFADSASSLGASSYRHTMKQPSAGTQPPSYTIGDYDVYKFRQWTGQVMDQLDLTIDAKGYIKHTAKWMGWTSASTSTPTPSWPTSTPFAGWQTTATIGGAGVTRLISAGTTIKRNTEVIHTLSNVQTPYNVFAGPQEANIKVQAVVEDYTEWNHLINNDQPTIVLTSTSTTAVGGVAPILVQTATADAWTKAIISRKGKYMVLDAEITAIQSGTDVGAMYFQLTNNVSSTY